MTLSPLTGAQKARLRGIAQTIEPGLKIGKQGITPAVLAEFERLLRMQELLKVRFVDADRKQRAAMTETLLNKIPCHHINSVGATAVFFLREIPDTQTEE